MKYHYVYRITNKVCRKHYYGVRSSNNHPKQDIGIQLDCCDNRELEVLQYVLESLERITDDY